MHPTEPTSDSYFRNGFTPASRIKLFAVLVSITIVVAVVSVRPDWIIVPNAAAAGNEFQNGAAIYTRSCSRCHGADGRAQTAKGKAVDAADFTSDDWQPDLARDIRIVTKGKGDMPTFKRTLKPAEIQAVVAYIRRFRK